MTDLLTGVKFVATSVARNIKHDKISIQIEGKDNIIDLALRLLLPWLG